MFWSLNQGNFAPWGRILPWDHRTEQTEVLGNGMYGAEDACRIYPGQADCVLRVARDGEAEVCFLMEGPVEIHPGVRFCLEQGTASAAGMFHPEARVRQQPLEICRVLSCLRRKTENGFFYAGAAAAETELLCGIGGTLYCAVDGRSEILRPGDLLLIGPGQWHMAYAGTRERAEYLSVTFEVRGTGGEKLRGFVPRSEENGRAEQLAQLTPGPWAEQKAAGLLRCLLAELLESGLPVQEKSAGEQVLIRRAQQYVSTHLQQPLTVPDMAAHADVSASYLTALFRRNLGISPGTYIRRARLQQSRELIRAGRLNFTEIAALLQYSTVHHFSRQFRENFGMTPTEYARTLKQNTEIQENP